MLKTFFEHSPTPYCIFRVIKDNHDRPVDYKFLAVNRAYKKMLDLEHLRFHDKQFYDLFPSGWQGENEWRNSLQEAVCRRRETTIQIHLPAIGKWIRVVLFPLDCETFASLHYDVTKEYLQEKILEGFFKVNIDMLCVSNTEGYFLVVNPAFEHILGYKREELEGTNYFSMIHPEDHNAAKQALEHLKKQRSVTKFVNRVRTKSGNWIYIEWHSRPDGDYIYSSGRDITATKQMQEQLEKNNKMLIQLTEELKKKNQALNRLAVRDELTGLYNRYYFNHRIKEEIRRADRESRILSMILIDLDHFKRVNDRFGHQAGDKVLKEAARLFLKFTGKEDVVVRLGGEEFCIIMPDQNLMEASHTAEKIREVMATYSFPIAGKLTASFGVAERIRNEKFEDWFKRADEALYEAKKKGRNLTVISKRKTVVPEHDK